MAPDDYRSRLIAVRKKLGLSRDEMAKRLLIPRAAYEQWEDGEKRAPTAVVRAAESIAGQREFTDQVLALADGSRTAAEIAEKLAVHRTGVYRALAELRRGGRRINVIPARTGAKLGSKQRITGRTVRASKRNERIAAAVRAGETYSAIGKRYDISRERVRQIADSLNVTSHRAKALRQGLKAERLAKEAAAKAAKRADLERRYARLRELVEGGTSILQAGRMVGFAESRIQRVSKELGLGAITRHGRWRALRSRERRGAE